MVRLPKVKRKEFRQMKYKEEYVEQAFIACSELGADDKALAKLFFTTEATINNWKIRYPEFLESLKRGKDIWDTENIEQSLAHRARGYSHPDVHISNYMGEITITEITKHYPPDTTACIFWLCNRNRDRWKSVNSNRLEDMDEDSDELVTSDFEFEIITKENYKDKVSEN